jgi:hypothetical protein
MPAQTARRLIRSCTHSCILRLRRSRWRAGRCIGHAGGFRRHGAIRSLGGDEGIGGEREAADRAERVLGGPDQPEEPHTPVLMRASVSPDGALPPCRFSTDANHTQRTGQVRYRGCRTRCMG